MNVENNSRRIVEYANFRPATPEEKQAAQGGILWRVVTCPLKIAYQTLGTWEMYQKGANTLTWQQPRIQSLVNRISVWMGYHPEYTFMRSFFSFRGNRHFLEDNTEVLKAFFKHHRQGEDFTNAVSSEKLYELVKATFPEETFSKEDFILTCSPEYTKMYHTLLRTLLAGSKLNQFDPQIRETARFFIENWAKRSQKGEEINVTEETRLFTSSLIVKLMFNEDQQSEKIAKSIDFINYYMIQSQIKATEKDRATFAEAIKTFQQAVETILKREDLPLFDQANTLSIAQKKVMIFSLLFAGQETTASLLTYILWKLALNSKLQDYLHDQIKGAPSSIPLEKLGQNLEAVKQLFTQSIKEFPPAYGVGRALKGDECLEFRFEGETQTRTCILPKGDMVVARMIKVAENLSPPHAFDYQNWFPFGGGKNRCPGEQLAIREICQFVVEILSDYSLETSQDYPIAKVGHITLKLAEDIRMTLNPR